MASAQATAARRSAALESIRRNKERLAKELKIEPPQKPLVPSTDTEMRQAVELENVAAFMQQISDTLTGEQTMSTQDNPTGAIQPDRSGGEADTAKEKAVNEVRAEANAKIAVAQQPKAAVAAEGEATYGDNDRPLSWFDGKSDEEALAEPGIGQATLDKIRHDQKAAAKAAAKK